MPKVTYRQLLILSLVVAQLYFPTIQSQDFDADDEDEDFCKLQTSIVMGELKQCGKEKSDDIRQRNNLLTSEIKEEIREMLTKEHEKMEKTLELIKAKVSENADSITSVFGCQKLHSSSDFNRTNVFNASGKKFYFEATTKMNWNKAHLYCSERGMHLATIKTSNELDLVKSELRKFLSHSRFWLSLSDIGWDAGQFHWTDGTLYDGSTWYPGGNVGPKQPNVFGAGKNTCVFLSTRNFKFFDAKCEDDNFSLCEIPATLSLCL